MNVRNYRAQVGSVRVKRATVAGSVLLLQLAGTAYAGQAEQAKRIYERIAGEPPSATDLGNMLTAMAPSCGSTVSTPCPAGSAGLTAAANYAAKAAGFYNVTLKNMVIPWTNRDQTVFAPLNDYAATVIGMVRDDVPFNTALSADVLYTVKGSSPAPSAASNDHYANAETSGIDLSTALTASTQTATYGLPAEAVAGLITTRGAASAFFINGTNRAMFRFTMINHMCHDMEQVMDTTRPSDRIRQDVARSPGGDSRIFMNQCAGCHSGMDPMAQAFAYYNYDATAGQMVYTANQVQPKYFINATNFPFGFVTPDNSWSNRWRAGPNASFGWDTASLPGSGVGAKSLGQELASSDRFAECQVTKVFQTVCFRAPTSAADMTTVATLKQSFKAGYKLKQVFVQSAVACAGS